MTASGGGLNRSMQHLLFRAMQKQELVNSALIARTVHQCLFSDVLSQDWIAIKPGGSKAWNFNTCLS
jgi:hypothetical protein